MSICKTIVRSTFVALLVLTVVLPAASLAAAPIEPHAEATVLNSLWQRFEEMVDRSLHSLVSALSDGTEDPLAPVTLDGGNTAEGDPTSSDPIGPTMDPNG